MANLNVDFDHAIQPVERTSAHPDALKHDFLEKLEQYIVGINAKLPHVKLSSAQPYASNDAVIFLRARGHILGFIPYVPKHGRRTFLIEINFDEHNVSLYPANHVDTLDMEESDNDLSSHESGASDPSALPAKKEPRRHEIIVDLRKSDEDVFENISDMLRPILHRLGVTPIAENTAVPHDPVAD